MLNSNNKNPFLDDVIETEEDIALFQKYSEILNNKELMSLVDTKFSNFAEPTSEKKVLENAKFLAESEEFRQIRREAIANFGSSFMDE